MVRVQQREEQKKEHRDLGAVAWCVGVERS